MTIPSAKVIADSVNPWGDRVTTLEVVMHRFVLAEFNTHRVFSRNSASSRAIPVVKQLDKVTNDPAWPVTWTSEQPGMQGGEPLVGDDLIEAGSLFSDVHTYTVQAIKDYLDRMADKYPDPDERKTHTLHKSLINRLMEPFMWHTVIVTSTEWMNFFHQRASHFSPLAQPEIQAAADAMWNAMECSTPRQIHGWDQDNPWNWHLPYIDENERGGAEHGEGFDVRDLVAISAARCARVSYLTHDGRRSIEEDLKLFDRLTSASPRHESPLEHPCIPVGAQGLSSLGNLTGFQQLRHHSWGKAA